MSLSFSISKLIYKYDRNLAKKRDKLIRQWPLLLGSFLSSHCSPFFYKRNGPIVDVVCGQTKNPLLCSKSLGSDPRSKSAPLPQLAQIAIDTAETDAIQAKIKIHSFVLGAKSPKLEDLYVRCENIYLDALSGLRDAPATLKGHQFAVLARIGVRIRGQVDACEAAFNNNSPFKPENQVVGVLADAIAVIANKL